MKWNHILDCKPENGRKIIRIDKKPYSGNYCVNVETYFTHLGDWEEYVETCKVNYWWIYPEEIIFPDKNIDN